MKLIVGLGNPGLIYAPTRHNIGFQVVKSLARSLKIDLKRDRLIYSIAGKGKCATSDIILAMPQTFMNLSGVAVKACFKKFKVSPADLLVICDDLDLELGRIKIRPGGSSGGQRGIDSIVEQIGTQEFSRLRIGIGRPSKSTDAAKYVLTGFLRKEKALVELAKENSADCCLSWVEKGVVETMNIFNTSLPAGRQGG
ncbi:MAG: aminoacyl-tRNA hydrolase [Candidatus Omnitrophota bacterium]